MRMSFLYSRKITDSITIMFAGLKPLLKYRIFIGALLAPTAAYWVLLLTEMQLSKIMRGFFWHSMHIYEIELGAFWLIVPMVIFAIFAVMFVLRSGRRYWFSLLLIMALGYAMQLGFGLMEGRGMIEH